MSLTLIKQLPYSVSIAVWQITETEDWLLGSLQLCPEDKAAISRTKLPIVRLQKLACRAALAQLLGTNKIEITYSETGQPQINNHHISFSHTKNSVAVALANLPVGIDIENLSPRILPLYPRFMSQKEIADCNINSLKELYFYWCSKEAMYKWFAKKKLDFIEDLNVCKNDNKGIICKKHIVQLTHFYIADKIIVVCS